MIVTCLRPAGLSRLATVLLRSQAPLIWVISVDLMHDRHDHLDYCHVQLRLQEMEVRMNHDHLDH